MLRVQPLAADRRPSQETSKAKITGRPDEHVSTPQRHFSRAVPSQVRQPDTGDQRRMMNEALDVIVALFKGETVNKDSDWFKLRNANLQLAPYTKPMIEMAVASARSPVGALAAARHGIGMLAIGGATPTSIAHHTANWNLYETEARKAGHTPDRSKWRVVTLMHIAETREQAKKNVRFGLKAFGDYFREIATFPIIPPDVPDDCDWLIETGTACIGTPDDAIAYIDKLLKGSGGFGV